MVFIMCGENLFLCAIVLSDFVKFINMLYAGLNWD